jgi:hypothetical protein
VPAESKKLIKFSENPNFYDILVTDALLLDFFYKFLGNFDLTNIKNKRKIQKLSNNFVICVRQLPICHKNWDFQRNFPTFWTRLAQINEIISQLLDFSFVFDICLIEIAQKLVKKSIS